MKNRFSKHFFTMFQSAMALAEVSESSAILLMMPQSDDWDSIKKAGGDSRVIVVTEKPEVAESAENKELEVIELAHGDSAVGENLSNALITAVADDILKQGSHVVVLYSSFDSDRHDSISLVQLDEHLGRLTKRDLQKIETKVPLEILKSVVDLAIEIGREGREGKPVGTMFVVGDHRKVLEQSHPAIFEMTKGYTRKDRNIQEPKVREAVKEMAQLDGAFIVSADGTIEGSCRIIDTAPVELMISHGLGSRHWSGAAISKNTKSVAIIVSESAGTVRIYQNGEIMLRIEPFRRRPMKWQDFGPDNLPVDAAD